MIKRSKPKCPNCQRYSNVYYCGECIQQGNFVHSSVKHPERYADKKLRVNQARSKVLAIGAKAETDCPPILKRDLLRTEIENLKEKNILIKKIIEEERQKKKDAEEEVKILNAKILELRKKNEEWKTVNEGLHENTIRYSSRIPKKKQLTSYLEKGRRYHVRKAVKELVNDVFPFCEIKPDSSEDEYENPAMREMVQSIDEATHTHYVKGKWVTIPHYLCHRNFSIISTVLPGSGEYASFARSQNGDEIGFRKEVDNIIAGLSFICQMVNCIANIINVPLPKSVYVRDFINLSGEDLEGKKFQKLVTRLNANVLFLCVSQGVSPTSLHPVKPLLGVNALFTEPDVDMGRLTSFQFPQQVIEILRDIDQLEDLPDSDTDSDWETINVEIVPDIPTISPPLRKISYDETASNMVTNAASSVLSIFGIGNN